MTSENKNISENKIIPENISENEIIPQNISEKISKVVSISEQEIWKDVPHQILEYKMYLSVSNQGRIKNLVNQDFFEIINPYGGYNTHGRYAGVILFKKTYYLHHLVYYSFHPEIVENNIEGEIKFKNFHPNMLRRNGLFRTYLEDLIFIPSTSININKILSESKLQTLNHPVYGEVTFGKWLPLYGHYYNTKIQKDIFEEYPEYEIKLNNSSENPCTIKSNHRLSSSGLPYLIGIYGNLDPTVSLSKDKKSHKFLLTHVLLASAFPHIKSLYTVDHIDDNPKNNHLFNLQWMSRSDNAKKGQEKSLTIARKGVGVRKLYKYTDGEYFCVEEFPSVCYAVNNIREEKQLKSKYDTTWGKIRRAMMNHDKGYTAYGYWWQEIKKEEPDFVGEEIWVDFCLGHSKYQVSSHGRIKKAYSITQGCPIRGRKYRTTCITTERIGQFKYNSEKFYMHQLVWIAFNGDIPNGYEILHDDTAPLNEDGTYRNWLQDLKLGTRSENSFEHHLALKTSTKK